MKTISNQKLLDAGYHVFDSVWNNAHRSYQKLFKDEHGKKYFIECYHRIYPNMPDWWDFELQIESQKGSVMLQTIQWFNDDGEYSQNTIEDVESLFEKFWEFLGKPYYEKNETQIKI